MDNRQILEKHFAIADYIAAVNGPGCEVIVHDLSDIKHSIAHIANGHITNRSVGGCITDFGLELLQKHENSDENFLANYLGTTQKGKRVLRSSTYFIRNENETIIGLLCVNIDITEWIRMRETLEQMITVQPPVPPTEQTEKKENFDMSVDELVHGIIESVISKSGIRLLGSSQEQKIELVKKMYDKGVFKFKGTVGDVARILDVSTQSIYRYLKEIEKK